MQQQRQQTTAAPSTAPTSPASPVTRNEMRPVKYHYADTFWCTYIISVVSANIAELGEQMLAAIN